MEDTKVDTYYGVQCTNYFTYKDKLFPFNIVFFNCFSQYFSFHHIQLEPNSTIKLLEYTEDDINLTDETINDFINYCQNQHIYLSKENVSSLHKLAKKFMVPKLLDSTEKFITAHRREFVIEYLSINESKENFTGNEYEEMISNDLIYYVKDERLLSLSMPVLYRIMTKYQQKIQEDKKHQQPSEITEFLFKCLDRFGRPASVLFDGFDFGISGVSVIRRLHDEYSEKFDFHFINPIKLKTVYELESEIIRREQKVTEEISAMRLENEEIKRSKDKQNKQNLKELKDEISEMKKKQGEIRIEIDDLKIKMEAQESTILSLRSKLADHDEMNRKIAEMMKEIEIMKKKAADSQSQQINKASNAAKPKKSCLFQSWSNTNGITSYLGNSVFLSCGGGACSDNPVSNIRNYNDDYFYNYATKQPASESDSFIKFDFGSKRIDLYSYFIRSNDSDENYCHPKTWLIEGSNDNTNWTKIDRQENDQNLRGKYKEHYFECLSSNHGNESSRYRFIRYVQEKSWDDRYLYHIFITYMELYGDIFE